MISIITLSYLNFLSNFSLFLLFLFFSVKSNDLIRNHWPHFLLSLIFIFLSVDIQFNCLLFILFPVAVLFLRIKAFNSVIMKKESGSYIYYTFLLFSILSLYLFRNKSPAIIENFSIVILALSLLTAGIIFISAGEKTRFLNLSGIIYLIEFVIAIHYPAKEYFKVSTELLLIISASFDFLHFIILIFNILITGKKKFFPVNNNFLNVFQDAVFIIDQGIIINCNKAAEKLFGYKSENIAGMSILDLSAEIQPNGNTSLSELDILNNKILYGEEFFTEWLYRRSDNTEFTAEVYLNKYPGFKTTTIINTVKDITRIRKIENIAKIASATYDNSFEGTFVVNPAGIFQFINRRFEEMTGYKAEELIGRNEIDFRTNIQNKEFYSKFKNDLLKKGKWSGNMWNKKKDGTLFISSLNITTLYNTNGEPDKIIGTIIDVTENLRNKRQLDYFLNYDKLTGLISKEVFVDNLSKNYLQLNCEITLFIIDINNFKYINDTYGYTKGDTLLAEYSFRLKSIIEDSKTLCRYSADEFILYFRDCGKEKTSLIIENIFNSIRTPFIINEEEVYITVSIGIAFSNHILNNSTNLLKKANIALHDAKKKGKNNFSFYKNEMKKNTYNRLKLENDLRSAINNNFITAFFQAKIDTKTDKIVGMETLARWIGAKNDIISPDKFITLAESTDLIYPMTEKILSQAINWTSKWNFSNMSNLRVAVNLSAKHFQNYNLIEVIENILIDAPINAENLEFEITESAFLNNSELVFYIFKSLKSMGIHISLDDFGTGYSSLSYLKKIPLDSLKIDKSFIDDIESNEQSRKLLKSIITIAKDLNLSTVAEGVENIAQKEILKDLECDMLQGYLFCKPLPPEDFSILLKSNTFSENKVF